MKRPDFYIKTVKGLTVHTIALHLGDLGASFFSLASLILGESCGVAAAGSA